MAETELDVARRLRRASEDAGRWLRADLADVVRIEPRADMTPALGGAAAGAEPAAVGRAIVTGLGRWRVRVSRRRAATLGLRWLGAALALGVLVELIAWAAGATTTTRASLLAGPAVVWVAGVTLGLRRGRPGVAAVARLLDHDLALREVVSTALELEGDSPTRGLPALVVGEGSTAVMISLRSARVAPRTGWIERALPAALAGVMAVMIAIPGNGSGAPHRSSAAVQRVAAAPTSGAGARRANSAGRRGQAGATARHPHASAPATHASRPHTGAGYSVPHASHGVAAGRTPGRPARTTSAPPAQAQPGHATARGRAAPGGGPTNGRPARGAPGHGATGRTSNARPVHAGAPGRAGMASTSPAVSGVGAGRHGRAGGESAGSARGSTVSGPHPAGRVPATVAGRLPIQSGYTPGVGGRRKSGSGPTAVGGRGAPRGVAVAGGGPASGAIFPYIPPAPALPPSLDNGLILSYFSPALSETWQ